MTAPLTADAVARSLGLQSELEALQQYLSEWVSDTNNELRTAIQWQFDGGSKFFRPFTTFSCYRGVYEGPIPPSLIQASAVVEMFHNVSLIIDDILDHSPRRRGRDAFHTRFGSLTALMASGYVVADGYRLLRNDPRAVELLSELWMRLGVAECMQWRLRRQVLGIDDWRRIAGEDTGAMFEACACLGTRSDELRAFGHLLGMLYHGCDDVGDVQGARALGGGGGEDLRDGILTLPAALAIRDPDVARLFSSPDPTAEQIDAMAVAFASCVPRAEAYLDALTDEARQAARQSALNPAPLLALVDETRQLANR